MRLFEDKRMPPEKLPEARESFRALKNKLDAEYKRMATIRGKAALSPIELRFYKPAIDDAWANTPIGRVRWNSRPNDEWTDALWNVADYMRHWSGNLRRAKNI
jgi:hypothetical protein